MIVAPKHRNDHLASAWTAGIALAMLVAGGYGATHPFLPLADALPPKPEISGEVELEDFALPAASENEIPETPLIEEVDIEIPPLPVIEQPVQPPEMAGLVPLENPPPALPPLATCPAQPPRPVVAARTSAASGATASGARSGGGPVTTFTGGGGRFPYPAYPAFARSAKQQGTVRLLVTVEPGGVPSSVEVQSSSGYSSLDAAARDQIRRRWRWPAGELRRFIVPVRFVLQ